MAEGDLVPIDDISDEDLIASLTRTYTRVYAEEHQSANDLWGISGLMSELRERGYTIKEYRQVEVTK